jgi:hypothetical protein
MIDSTPTQIDGLMAPTVPTTAMVPGPNGSHTPSKVQTTSTTRASVAVFRTPASSSFSLHRHPHQFFLWIDNFIKVTCKGWLYLPHQVMGKLSTNNLTLTRNTHPYCSWKADQAKCSSFDLEQQVHKVHEKTSSNFLPILAWQYCIEINSRVLKQNLIFNLTKSSKPVFFVLKIHVMYFRYLSHLN